MREASLLSRVWRAAARTTVVSEGRRRGWWKGKRALTTSRAALSTSTLWSSKEEQVARVCGEGRVGVEGVW